MMSTKLETIIKQTKENSTYVVIWLHGLGADGNDFVPVLDAMDFSQVKGIKFIFPYAPVRPITVNGGMPMRGWYDIATMEIDQRQDSAGVTESSELIAELINDQIEAGFDEKNIFLAGFSQGGAIALYCGLSLDFEFAGILALSTYVPIHEHINIKHKPPIFYAHGNADPIIPLEIAQKSHEWLLENGIIPSWHEYSMQHQVLMEEIVDINKWLVSRINDLENN